MPRASAPNRSCQAGFTIIEVLVALAVMATSLAAIASVASTSARASRSLDQRVALLQTARAVETGIPARRDIAVGETDGEIAGNRWRMDVRPFTMDGASTSSPWIPRTIVINVRAPSGPMTTIETVRLVRKASE